MEKNAKCNEFPIAFMSKKFNQDQYNYSVIEKESLEAMLCKKILRAYVVGHEFKVITLLVIGSCPRQS